MGEESNFEEEDKNSISSVEEYDDYHSNDSNFEDFKEKKSSFKQKSKLKEKQNPKKSQKPLSLKQQFVELQKAKPYKAGENTSLEENMVMQEVAKIAAHHSHNNKSVETDSKREILSKEYLDILRNNVASYRKSGNDFKNSLIFSANDLNKFITQKYPIYENIKPDISQKKSWYEDIHIIGSSAHAAIPAPIIIAAFDLCIYVATNFNSCWQARRTVTLRHKL